ncbi:MAG: hypothetical protein R2839_12620 [Thermomicrobiales bacterium]
MAIALAGGLMLAMLLVSRSWNQLTLADIEFSRSLDTNRALPGDTVILSISASIAKPLPTSSLRIDEAVDETIVPVGYRSTLSGGTGKRIVHLTGHLRPYEKQTWTVRSIARNGDRTRWVRLLCDRAIHSDSSRPDQMRRTISIAGVIQQRIPLVSWSFLGQRPAGEQRARTPITDSLLIRGLRRLPSRGLLSLDSLEGDCSTRSLAGQGPGACDYIVHDDSAQPRFIRACLGRHPHRYRT